MNLAKKITLIVASVIVLVATSFGVWWIFSNWKNLTSGTQLYTQKELEEYGDAKAKEEREKWEQTNALNNSLKLQIAETEERVKSLTIELEKYKTQLADEKSQNIENQEKITSLEAQIDDLNSQKTEMQNEIVRMQELLDGYATISEGARIVNFYVGEEKVKNAVIVNTRLSLTSSDLPDITYLKENYSVKVNSWATAEGVVYYENNKFTENNRINSEDIELNLYASSYTRYYDIKFGEYATYKGLKGKTIDEIVISTSSPEWIRLNDKYWLANPIEKEGYMFQGWTLDGINKVSIDDIVIQKDITFQPIFVQATRINFDYEGWREDIANGKTVHYLTYDNTGCEDIDTLTIYPGLTPICEINNFDNVYFMLEVYGWPSLTDTENEGEYQKTRYVEGRLNQLLHLGGLDNFTVFIDSNNEIAVKFTNMIYNSNRQFKMYFKYFYEIKE